MQLRYVHEWSSRGVVVACLLLACPLAAWAAPEEPAAPAAAPADEGQAVVRGVVQDPMGMGVSGVDVRFRLDGVNVETITDDGGRFELRDLAPGRWSVFLDKEGFEPAKHEVVVDRAPATPALLIEPELVEIVVLGIRPTWRDVEAGAREVEPEPLIGTYELTRRDIETTTGSMEDITRAAHALPGVVSDGDLLAGFHVRGGEQKDVVYMLDRVPLDNPFHLAGFNSIFNPDTVERVQFYAGAAPADVPAATSAVMAVESWDGRPRSDSSGIDGAVDLSASSARALVMGPIDPQRKLTMALAARRTYLEGYFQVMKWLDVLDSAFAAPEFSELSARVAYRPSPRQRVILSALRTTDSIGIFDSEDDTLITVSGGFELRNRLILTSLDHTAWLGEHVEWRSTVAYTDDSSFQERTLAGSASRRFDVRRVYGRSDVSAELGDHTLKVGVDAAWQQVDAEERLADTRAVPSWAQAGIADLGLPEVDVSYAEPWAETSTYAQATVRGPVRVRAGVRGSFDGLSSTWLASPRAGVSVPLAQGATVPKVAWGIYHRTQRNPLQLDPRVGNPDLRPERAEHFVLGLDQAFPLPGQSAGGLFRIEGYVVKLSNLVVTPDNQAAVDAGTSFENQGSGTNTGVDVMAVARTPRWTAQLTYGLLFATRRNPLNEQFPETVAPPQDQRHTLQLSGEWQASRRWRLSTRYVFHSGRPVSVVVPASEDTIRIVGLNTERLGPQHQIDLRTEWRRDYRGYRLSFYLEVLNVGNIQSPFLPIHDVQDGELSSTTLNHLPMRPFLGLRADF